MATTDYRIIGFRRHIDETPRRLAGAPENHQPQLWLNVGKRQTLVRIDLDDATVKRLLKELVGLL